MESKWTVHEWGTFTSLQNENGEAIGGINTDDEPVPQFVHRLANYLLLLPTEIPTIFFQGAPSCHPDVTMRLETLTVDELSRIWDSLDAAYSTSLSYEASVVDIDLDAEPDTGPPVAVPIVDAGIKVASGGAGA